PSVLDAMFTVDFVDPFDATNKLMLSSLTSASFNPSSIVHATFDAAADINLDLVLGFGTDATFPSLAATFSLDWNFVDTPTDATGSSFGGTPDISFNDVRINLGEFFSTFAGPIIDEIQKFTEPLQPAIDFLNSRMPIV